MGSNDPWMNMNLASFHIAVGLGLEKPFGVCFNLARPKNPATYKTTAQRTMAVFAKT